MNRKLTVQLISAQIRHQNFHHQGPKASSCVSLPRIPIISKLHCQETQPFSSPEIAAFTVTWVQKVQFNIYCHGLAHGIIGRTHLLVSEWSRAVWSKPVGVEWGIRLFVGFGRGIGFPWFSPTLTYLRRPRRSASRCLSLNLEFTQMWTSLCINRFSVLYTRPSIQAFRLVKMAKSGCLR